MSACTSWLDNNVPDSVAEVFRRHGHSVTLLRDILPADSPDPVVAAFSEDKGFVLISADRDFRKIAPRIPRAAKARFQRLSRITIQCNPYQTVQRIEKAMSLIEAESRIAQDSQDKRMIITIGNAFIRTDR